MAKKKKLPYWDRRAIDQDIKVHDELNTVENKVMSSYQKAQSYLRDEVKKVYRRYLSKSDLSEDEVKKILNTSASQTNIVDLQSIVKTVKDPGIKKQAQDYLTGMAVKSRISRLEDLKAKSYLVSKQVADVQLSRSTDYYIDVIKEAYNQASAEAIIGKSESALKLYNDGKYPTYVFDDDKAFIEFVDPETGTIQKRIELKKDEAIPEFKEMSTKQVRNVLDTKWQGSNYSKRIWGDTDLLADKLQELFTVEAMTGMSERDMTKEIQKVFDVSRGVARRLIRTEANYMAGQGKLKGWIAQGVEYYVIVATLDLRTSKVCQDQDGKKYKVSEAKVNVNYPPFHPFCRSVARAWFNEKTLSGKRFANDPISGKRFEISHADSYKKWEQMLIDQHGKEDLQLARKKVKNFNADLKQFNRYKSVIGPENTLKTLDDFQDMKYNEGRDYKLIKTDYNRRMKLKNNPELKLPNAGIVKADDSKFANYLFDRNSETGYPKGKLITSKLGYDLSNYSEFKDEIIANAKNYPSIHKGDNKYGSRYEVNMILYNKNKEPVNLKTAWLVNGESTHLTTTFIEEAKG